MADAAPLQAESAALGSTVFARDACPQCQRALSVQASKLGCSLRCVECQSTQHELRDEPTLALTLHHSRWDVHAKQELLPVTLACDKQALEGAPPQSGPGLWKHKFEPYEIASDALASSAFVTGFDCFEVTCLVSELNGVSSIAGDLIEMGEVVFQLGSEGSAGRHTQDLTLEDLAGEATPTPNSMPAVAAAASKDTSDAEEARAACASLLRTVSTFVKSQAKSEAPGLAQAPKPSMSRAPTLTASIAAPFSTVKEETMSDLEVASDMSSRAASQTASASGTGSVSAGSGAPESRTSSTSSGMPTLVPFAPPALVASPSPVLPLAAGSPPPTAAAPAATPLSAAQTMEQEFKGFLGLDSLELEVGEEALSSLSAIQRLPSYAGPPPAASAMSGDDPEMPGLQVSLGAYFDNASLGVATESSSGLAVRSYSLMRTLSSQLGSALDEFSAPVRNLSSFVADPSSFDGLLTRQPTLSVFQQSTSQLLSNQLSFGGNVPMPPPPPHFQQSSMGQQMPSRLPSGVSGAYGAAGGAALASQTNSFSSLGQRFPSILQQGVFAAASFQHVYNEDVRAQMAGSSRFASWEGDRMGSSSMDFGSSSLSASPSIGAFGGLPIGMGSEPSNPPSLPHYGGSGSQGLVGGSQELNDYEAPLVGPFGPDAGSDSQGSHGYGGGEFGSKYDRMHLGAVSASPPSMLIGVANTSPSPQPLDSMITRRGDQQNRRQLLLGTKIMTQLAAPRGSPAATGATESSSFPASLSALSRILDLVSGALREPLTDFFRVLNIDDVTSKLAAFICAETQKRGLCATRQNSSVSGAALYMALIMENKRPTQSEFCKKVEITEVTLRKVLGELTEHWGLLVPVAYTPRVVPRAWPERAKPPPPPPAERSARPMRSSSSTIHALHGEWKNRLQQPASAAPAPIPNALPSRAPSFLYAPPAAAPSSSAAPSSQARRDVLPPRRQPSLPPGFVATSVTSPPQPASTGPASVLRFNTPIALTTAGRPIVVVPRVSRANDATLKTPALPSRPTADQLTTPETLAKWIKTQW